MAAIQTGSGNNRCRATLGHVVSGTSEWGMVENVVVAYEIALPSFFRSKVISTSGLHHRHFAFPMSADVGPCRQWHI